MPPNREGQPPTKVHALIIGQGLAGSCLAWAMEHMGLEFRIIDPGRDKLGQPTSSRLAAGLVSPLTGPRFTVNWRYHELLPMADAFYRETEHQLRADPDLALSRQPWWQELDIVRLLLDDSSKASWDKRRRDPEAAALVQAQLPGPIVSPEGAAAPHGALVMRARRLDCPGWLGASRARWARAGRLIKHHLDPHELIITPGHVGWHDLEAQFVVWCVGAEIGAVPWFQSIPTRHQIGDVLRLDPLPCLGERVLNGGAWLMTDQDDNGERLTRAGATYYEVNRPVPAPAEARRQLLEKLRGLGIDLPPVRDQKRATRPVIAGRRVVAGRSEAECRIAWLNGFGSKGVLKAPFFARNLAQHLWGGGELDSSVAG